MKRFIDIGRQLHLDETDEENSTAFSFYCTITGRYERFSGSQTWESISEFIEDYQAEGGAELPRYLGLIPDQWRC